jgi:hypothetical protein
MELLLYIVRWLIAVPAGLIFALCILINGMALVALWVKPQKRGYSIMVFFGPVFGLVFFLTIPIPGAARYWWVALVADPITWIGLAFLLSQGLEKLVRSRDA